MNITDIRIRKIYTDSRLRALVSITVDHDLAVHDIKIIEGPERLFVAMPSRKDESGAFRDISHPITPQARKQLEDAVLNAYQQYIRQPEHIEPPMHPKITLKGLEYLQENSMMKKAAAFAKGLKDAIDIVKP